MKNAQSLEHTLNRYEQILNTLEKASPLPCQEQILDVLITRDAVQAALTETNPIPTASLLKLDELDNRLRKHRETMELGMDLGHWREILKPSEDAWWWLWETPSPPTWWEQIDWAGNFLIIIFLTASVSLVADISSKFLSGGLDTLSSLTVFVPSVLALLTSGALTEVGREARKYVFSSLKIPNRYWQLVSTLIAFIFMLLLIWFHAALPRIGVYFNQKGVENYKAGQLDSALSNYQKAIALRPNYAKAHYHLGLLYEDLQKFDQALASYQLAVRSNLDSLELLVRLKAYNNLGRLYILKNDYATAVPPLLNGLDLIDEEALDKNEKIKIQKYNLLKNLGWVQLKQKYYVDAYSLLKEAIDLYQEKAPAHCLLAQVLEGQDKKREAFKSWKACLQYVDINKPDQYLWRSLALEKTAPQDEKP